MLSQVQLIPNPYLGAILEPEMSQYHPSRSLVLLYVEKSEFQISGFRHGRQNRVIGGRAAPFQKAHASSRRPGGFIDDFEESLLVHMMGTRGCRQYSAGT